MITISAIEFTMNKGVYYLGIIRADDLINNYKVDEWSANNPRGYQRHLAKNRSKKFTDYIGKFNGIFHQTILINIRNKNKISYDRSKLVINDELFIVDGQHRIWGLKLLLDSNPSYSSMSVPVLIMVGYNQENEAREFLIVNKTQKGVKADLADRILTDVVNKMDAELLEIIGIKGPMHILDKAVSISDKLNKSKKSIWYKRIALPNDQAINSKTITQRSMTESLKHVLKDPYVQTNYKPVDSLSNLLIEYWNAIKSLCPKACGDDAKNYVLLKSMGTFLMHKLFPFIIIKCGRNITKAKMKNILSKIEQMCDDDWHGNGEMGEGSSQKFVNIKFEDFKSQID